jgi:hypothetical protein
MENSQVTAAPLTFTSYTCIITEDNEPINGIVQEMSDLQDSIGFFDSTRLAILCNGILGAPRYTLHEGAGETRERRDFEVQTKTAASASRRRFYNYEK